MRDSPVTTEERAHVNLSTENWQNQLSVLFVELKTWWAGLELESKAFVALLVCLCTNIFLIRIAWNVYGDKLTQMFMKGWLFVCLSFLWYTPYDIFGWGTATGTATG